MKKLITNTFLYKSKLVTQWLLNISVGIILIVVSLSIWAQPNSTPNGCGSGWNKFFVPNEIKAIGCSFKKACDIHDICYGSCEKPESRTLPQCSYLRCQKGGDLFGKSQCDDVGMKPIKIEAENRRAICDGGFLVDLVKTNPGNDKCTFFSALYPFAVRLGGRDPFRGMHQEEIAMTETQRKQSIQALNSILNDWPKEKQERFFDDLKNGKLNIDLSKPIRLGANNEIRN